MLPSTTPLITAMYQGSALPASARLIAEWNQNRYAGISTVANFAGTAEYNPDYYPISSIVLPNRPAEGIVKARAQSPAIHGYTGGGIEGFTVPKYSDGPAAVRYYAASRNSLYKYWCSPAPSNGSGVLANTQPYVVYTNLAWANKIVIGFESSIANPTAFTVQTTIDGTAWVTVATNPSLDAQGRVTLYRQAGGTWTSTVYRDNPMQIKGVRVNVTALDQNNTFLSLIEISSRLEQDLSAYIINDAAQLEQSDFSFVAPIGAASSNTSSITLSNIDGRFDNDRLWLDYPTNTVPNLLYGLIDKNAQFRVDYGIDTTGFGGGSGVEYVRQLTMWTGDWQGQNESQVGVTLVDSSTILQQLNPNPTLFEKMTVGEIIWRLCEAVGFTNYQYTTSAVTTGTQIPYYWTDGTKTLWEAISEISQGTQTAVFFDENDVLQIQTRDAAYDVTKAITWTFDATPVDAALVAAQSRPAAEIGKLPDLISANTSYNFEANTVNVNYKNTTISDFQNGFPVMETVWEPDDTVTLRASVLQYDMTSSQTTMKIRDTDISTWPYTGTVQLEGEFIQYGAKEYSWYNPVFGFLQRVPVRSEEEKASYDSRSGTNKTRNFFTGTLMILVRGAMGSTAKAHNATTLSAYTSAYRGYNGAYTPWSGGFNYDFHNSLMSLRTNSSFGLTHWYTFSQTAPATGYYYGARLKFPSTGGYTDGAAGLFISAGTNDSGYFFDITRTSVLDRAGRTTQHELNFYVRKNDGTYVRYGANGGLGVPLAVSPDTWYDIDVSFNWHGVLNSGNRDISIKVNGVQMMTVNLTPGQYPNENITARYGVFARGFTFVDFEHTYSNALTNNPVFDQETVFDTVQGGYISEDVNRVIYPSRSYLGGYLPRGVNNLVTPVYGAFDMRDYGPIVHEVRSFDVKFTKAPCVHSRIYISNESQVICPEYNANPFEATFILANTARVNAIVEGEDTLTYGIDNSVQQKLLVYGRTVNQDDTKTVTVTNQPAIARRGVVSLDIDSSWIQSEAAAKALGDWIVLHWAGGNDEVVVNAFGNPYVQIGDLVAVNYPDKSMFRTTHKYFVVKKESSFDNGIGTTFTLRRAKV